MNRAGTFYVAVPEITYTSDRFALRLGVPYSRCRAQRRTCALGRSKTNMTCGFELRSRFSVASRPALSGASSNLGGRPELVQAKCKPERMAWCGARSATEWSNA